MEKADNKPALKGNKGGFTLVELLITLLIMGILAGIAVPIYLGQREKSINVEAQENLLALRQLLEQYYNENGCYYKTGGACSDATLYFNQTSNTIQTSLPGFRPGNASALYFSYNITTNTTATRFVASAVRTSSNGGNIIFNINQDNNRSGF
ncbi:MAG: prepilin-type N-terminal cleavage/methylation domain-containing protein [Nitrospirae bacterium YQR-1]